MVTDIIRSNLLPLCRHHAGVTSLAYGNLASSSTPASQGTKSRIRRSLPLPSWSAGKFPGSLLTCTHVLENNIVTTSQADNWHVGEVSNRRRGHPSPGRPCAECHRVRYHVQIPIYVSPRTLPSCLWIYGLCMIFCPLRMFCQGLVIEIALAV